MEINGVKEVSVGRREARRVLCGWTAMLHELEEQVETFFEFDVTIGGGVANALCAAWWLIQQGSAELIEAGSGNFGEIDSTETSTSSVESLAEVNQADEDTAPRHEHLSRPARRPRNGRLRRAQGKGPVM